MTPTPHEFALRGNAIIDIRGAADGAAPARPTFAIIAYTGGALKLGGFARPVVVDLAGLRVPKRTPILLDHDDREIVGQSDRFDLSNAGLRLAGFVSGNHEDPGTAAGKVVLHARGGFQWSASVGVSVDRLESISDGQTVSINGKSFTGPLSVVRAGRLGEVSFVAIGADENAEAKIAAKGQTSMIDPSNMTTAVTDPVTQERERIIAIRDTCRGEHQTIEAKAISDGWTTEQTGAAVLAAVRSSRPALAIVPHAGATPDAPARDVLTAALLMHAGHATTAEKQLGGHATQRAADLHCRSLVDICAAALRLSGHDVPPARGEMIRAAFSTSSLPTALGDSAAKIAISQYQLTPATWRAFAKIAPVKDFKTTSLIRAAWGGAYEALAPTGEIKHGTIGEEVFSVQAATYAKMLAITRADIINDDLGVLSGAAEGLGRMAARAVSDCVYAALLANLEPDGATSFYAEARENLLSGAGSALGVAALTAAIAAQRARLDSDGREIDAQPRVLLVPPALEMEARALIASATVARYVSETAEHAPEGNPLAGLLDVQVEPRLSNIRFPGYSTTAWYVFSAPADGAVAVAFLNGVEAPVIEQVDLGPDRLGVGWRGYIDFGVSLADYRATTKSAGV